MSNRLILLRHGQSQYNLENRLTGTDDPPLTAIGISEARRAASRLLEMGIDLGAVYTSSLSRAKHTANIIVEGQRSYSGNLWTAPALNERDYGQLTGLTVAEAEQEWGVQQVARWRCSESDAPPGGESLREAGSRAQKFCLEQILPALRQGNVLAVTHHNVIKGLMMAFEGLTADQLVARKIENCELLAYSLADQRSFQRSTLPSNDDSRLVRPPAVV